MAVILTLTGCGLTNDGVSGADRPIRAEPTGTAAVEVSTGQPPPSAAVPALATASSVMLNDVHLLWDQIGFAESPPDDLSSAIVELQKLVGLEPTGALAGPDIALLEAITNADSFEATIKRLQTDLRSAGYRVDEIDGIFGSGTVAAWMAFTYDNLGAATPALSETALEQLDEPVVRSECPATGPGVAYTFADPSALVDLAAQLHPPLTVPFTEAVPITGEPLVDDRIRELAEARGYRLRSEPVRGTATVGGVDLEPRVAQDFRQLTAAASSDGVALFAASGLRGVERQRQIFVSALDSAADGGRLADLGDDVINGVLDQHAPPGYSKHHTGYALDIAVPEVPLEDFASTDAYGWLRDDGYLNARRFGFVPSYPVEAPTEGPVAEPWEWQWVGVDALYRCPPEQ